MKIDRRAFVYLVVLFTVAASAYWFWETQLLLSDLSNACVNEMESFPLEICGAIAERDIWSTYYLKVLALSVLALGSTALMLTTSRDKGRN